MTRKIFWEDPYLCELDTRVARVADNAITLAETIFYAMSGGQESDAGTINGLPVSAARKTGSDIVYELAQAHGLAPGDPARVRIDWPRRYRLMRLHFAAEVILELVYRNLPGIEKIGAHIAPDKARIDFAWHENISPLFDLLKSQAMRVVAADSRIISAFSDERAEARFWEVEGFARVPCGGTHLRRTGEVGEVFLRRRNVGKGKERIEVRLDEPG